MPKKLKKKPMKSKKPKESGGDISADIQMRRKRQAIQARRGTNTGW